MMNSENSVKCKRNLGQCVSGQCVSDQCVRTAGEGCSEATMTDMCICMLYVLFICAAFFAVVLSCRKK